MKRSWPVALIQSRYLWAAFAGLLMALSFPNTSVAGLAWVAPALMVFAGQGAGGAERFRVGYVAGLALYMGSLHWLLNIPYRWHGIPLAPALGWVALSAFLALMPAFWVWLVCSASTPSAEPGSPPARTPALLRWENFESLLGRSWLRRTCWALGAAAAWVSMEMYITRIFGGFPWNLAGTSQFRLTPLLQVATWTGVYGISFLIFWFSVSLVPAAVMLVRYPNFRARWIAELFLPAICIAVLFSVGYRQIQQAPEPSRALTLTLIQPSIPQTLIWDPASDDARFQHLLDLTEQALTNATDLVIWPEAAVPKLLRYDQDTFDKVSDLARRHKVWMIIGADDAEPRRHTPQKNDADYYNSSFLISPEGRLVERYRKRSLVIFGEYIPLARWLPVLSWFTPIQGGFTAGTEPGQFDMPELEVTAAVLICYEDVFPQLGRSAAEQETDFLVNITNNGWFGEGFAQWQHGATALLRAVETRRPLVRCTNSGLTCWIDEYGRLRQVLYDSEGKIYGKAVMRFELPLRSADADLPQTFFNRYGDVFGWSCVAVTAIWFLARLGIPGVSRAERGQTPLATSEP